MEDTKRPSWGKQKTTDPKSVLQMENVTTQQCATAGLLLGPRLPTPHPAEARVEEMNLCGGSRIVPVSQEQK